ncbi:hypothetical protein OC846_002223 [Tilletia horrida]|uniref:C3H1-type domain-containing protein n=1 Tax=Tilletia horrida TaxID=155126 RepID=A0AAN6JZ46_9BASI|nr:hypothetical protein OC846_002223 [Tilletia horrida]KAK0568986.1 hypothetical protein OC861_001423 [Tilletia horrida]
MQWTASGSGTAGGSVVTKAGAGAKNKTLVLNQPVMSSSNSSGATGQTSAAGVESTSISTGTTRAAAAATKMMDAGAKAKINRLQQHSKVIADMQRFRNAQQGKVYKPASRRPTTTAQEKKGLCVYFTRTGKCKRGLTCTYKHDAAKLALCPRMLSAKGCTLKARGKQCLLSHSPNPHRVPHCEFYTRDRTCRNAERAERQNSQGEGKARGCLYTHSDKIRPDTPICEQFAKLAYCEKGQDCDGRHTFECPEFAAKGTCSRRGCRMMHIVSAAAAGDAEKDELIFERDDAAAFRNDDDDDEDGVDGKEAGSFSIAAKKRKRYDEQSSDDDGEGDEDIDGAHHDIDDVEDFSSRPKKKHQGQSFVTQQDFISFGDPSDDDTADDDDDGDDADDYASSGAEAETAEGDEDASVQDEDEEQNTAEDEDEDPEFLGSEDEADMAI